MSDTEAVAQLKQLLDTYRRRLAYELRQQARQGSAASFETLEGIQEARLEIERIKQELRHKGVDVPDQLYDRAIPDPPPMAPFPQPQRSARLALIGGIGLAMIVLVVTLLVIQRERLASLTAQTAPSAAAPATASAIGAPSSQPIGSPTIAPLACADRYEPDDSAEQAVLIKSNEIQTEHAFCPDNDRDWVRFFAKGVNTYYLYTDTRPYSQKSPLGVTGVDTLLYIVDSDMKSVLDFNDNITDPPSLDSAVYFVPKQDGWYYAYVVNTGGIGGATLRYDLGLQLCPFNQRCGSRPESAAQPDAIAATPTLPTTFDEFAHTPTPTQTFDEFAHTPTPLSEPTP